MFREKNITKIFKKYFPVVSKIRIITFLLGHPVHYLIKVDDINQHTCRKPDNWSPKAQVFGSKSKIWEV